MARDARRGVRGEFAGVRHEPWLQGFEGLEGVGELPGEMPKETSMPRIFSAGRATSGVDEAKLEERHS